MPPYYCAEKTVLSRRNSVIAIIQYVARTFSFEVQAKGGCRRFFVFRKRVHKCADTRATLEESSYLTIYVADSISRLRVFHVSRATFMSANVMTMNESIKSMIQ